MLEDAKRDILEEFQKNPFQYALYLESSSNPDDVCVSYFSNVEMLNSQVKGSVANAEKELGFVNPKMTIVFPDGINVPFSELPSPRMFRCVLEEFYKGKVPSCLKTEMNGETWYYSFEYDNTLTYLQNIVKRVAQQPAISGETNAIELWAGDVLLFTATPFDVKYYANETSIANISEVTGNELCFKINLRDANRNVVTVWQFKTVDEYRELRPKVIEQQAMQYVDCTAEIVFPDGTEFLYKTVPHAYMVGSWVQSTYEHSGKHYISIVFPEYEIPYKIAWNKSISEVANMADWYRQHTCVVNGAIKLRLMLGTTVLQEISAFDALTGIKQELADSTNSHSVIDEITSNVGSKCKPLMGAPYTQYAKITNSVNSEDSAQTKSNKCTATPNDLFMYNIIVKLEDDSVNRIHAIKKLSDYEHLFDELIVSYSGRRGIKTILIVPDGGTVGFTGIPSPDEFKKRIARVLRHPDEYYLILTEDSGLQYFWRIVADRKLSPLDNVKMWVKRYAYALTRMTSISLFHYSDKLVSIDDIASLRIDTSSNGKAEKDYQSIDAAYLQLFKNGLAQYANSTITVGRTNYFLHAAVCVSAMWLQYTCMVKKVSVTNLKEYTGSDKVLQTCAKMYKILTRSGEKHSDMLSEIYITERLDTYLYEVLLPADETSCYSIMAAFVEEVKSNLN